MKISPKVFRQNGAISQKQYEAHIKLYGGYIDKYNEITEDLAENAQGKVILEKANSVYSQYRGLKKGETFALDSIILHEEYFKNLCTEASQPLPATLALIGRSYGTQESFLRDFAACCTAARGWCISCFEQRTGQLKNILCDAHDQGSIALSYPILVCDMYEHAYFVDYITDKAAYIKSFISFIDWAIVEKRVKMLNVPK